ncbi:MAG: hypothetical protein IJH07_02435 [Ruminococcus sp.]|nr:hypothetical protein [Ruminococcus sp.]
MKDKLKSVMKPAPERFHYTVQSAITEATKQASPAKKRIPKGWRIAIAVILIAALIPSTIFGASKLYELIAKPVDNYGLELNVERETAADYPKYVKMHVEVPEGFAAVPGTDQLKYYNLSTEEPYTDGFSLFPMRFRTELEQKEYIGNVNSYEEREMIGHQAYEVKLDQGWDRLYIYYEDVNVFLLIYHKDVTEKQLADFVKGITFTEGTQDNFTYLDWPHDERGQDVYTYDEEYAEYPRDTKITFMMYSPETDDFTDRCTAQITDVQILDNIAELDYDAFCPAYSPYEIADQDGWLNPETFTTYKEGDGFDAEDEVIGSETANQKLVLADVTYENLSDHDIELFVSYSLEVLEKDDDGTFHQSNIIDGEKLIYSTPYTDGETVYLTPHGVGDDFCIFTIPAQSSAAFTMGWRCKADMIDKAYLTNIYQGSVTDPPAESDSPYYTYLFKVTDDDR